MDAMKELVNKAATALHLGGSQQEHEEQAPPPSDAEFKELQQKYEKAGQGHVFEFWEELKPQEKVSLPRPFGVSVIA